MTYATNDLRSLFNTQQGPAKANQWKVKLPQINGSTPGGGGVDGGPTADMDLLCTAVRFPGKTVRTLDRQIGLEPLKVANGYDLTQMSMTFYLTNKFTARKYWQAWMDLIINPTPPYTAGFLSEYGKQVSITQLDAIGGEVYTIKLLRAFPTDMQEIELNNQPVSSTSEMTVTLQYSHYEVA